MASSGGKEPAAVTQARRDIPQIEAARPLARPVLTALNHSLSLINGGSTAGEVFARLNIAKGGEISAEINRLESEQLVFGAGEGTSRRFALTRAGEDRLTAHLAFGQRETPQPQPLLRDKRDLLSIAFERASSMLDEGQTEGALARMTVIQIEAEKMGTQPGFLELAETVEQQIDVARDGAQYEHGDDVGLSR
jgi:hypothetical protein